MKRIDLLGFLVAACLWTACEDLTDVENTIPEVKTGEVSSVTAREASIAVMGDDTDYYYLELSTDRTFSKGNTLRLERFTARRWQAAGLKPGTTYYYRQCATDGLSVVNGPVRQFTTDPLVNINSIRLRPWNSEVASEVVTDGQIGIFFTDADTWTDYARLRNFVPDYDQLTGEWLMPFDLVPPERPHLFLAYAPYSSSISDKRQIPVSIIDENIDYWSGRSITEVTAARCSADIEMHHALARVVFNVVRGNDSNTDIEVKSYTLSRTYFPVTGYLDLEQDTIIADRTSEVLRRTVEATTLGDEPQRLEFYVIPFAFSDNQLDFSVNASESYGGLYKSAIPASDWRAGFQYEYPVTVTLNSMEIGDVQVTPWTDVNGGDVVIKN